MFEHLQVFNIKGLQECTLLDLGKINVVCGKNNSGKSTLLEGIDSPSNRAFGKSLGEEAAKQVYAMTVAQMGWGSTNPDHYLNQRYMGLLRTVVGSRDSWYSSEEQTFMEQVRDGSAQGLFEGYAFAADAVKRAYQSLFAEPPRTVLLPPKRSLEVEAGISIGAQASPRGDGITNCLFHAKNQPEGSEERCFLARISEAFSRVSSGYTFDIFTLSLEHSTGNRIGLSFSYKDPPWISARDSGLGLQDLLVILYFSLGSDYDVILIEEPESHMHPDMQRRLLHLLHSETSKQFFLTTHSNVFLNSAFSDKVFFTYFEDSVKVDDATSRAAILHDIGYDVTDNLVSDLVILVEGPKDIPVLEEFLMKWGLFGSYNIKIWPLGGDIMDQVDLSVFAENYSIAALIDHDPGSQKIRQRFIANCERYRIPVHQLERYAVENYFSLRALREQFGSQIDSSISRIDPNTKLEDQIGFNVKRNSRRIAQIMTLDEIKDTDLYEFFVEVESLCKSREARA
jgi:hypothetical protein